MNLFIYKMITSINDDFDSSTVMVGEIEIWHQGLPYTVFLAYKLNNEITDVAVKMVLTCFHHRLNDFRLQ